MGAPNPMGRFSLHDSSFLPHRNCYPRATEDFLGLVRVLHYQDEVESLGRNSTGTIAEGVGAVSPGGKL